MTENEAKKIISRFCEDRMNFARGKDMSDKELEDFCKFSEALSLSVISLEEIQQYREIGAVEECREAMEKRKPKTAIDITGFRKGIRCPLCGKKLNKWIDDYCWCCGQHVSWKESEEEDEKTERD